MELYRCFFITLLMVVQTFAIGSECYYGFCNNTENYPYERIERLLQKNHEYIHFFKSDPSKNNYVRRRRGVANDICATNSIGLYPKLARNIKGDFTTVVNTEDYHQYVKMEQCLQFSCKPKMNIVELAAYNNVTDSIYLDKFSVPSTCYSGNKQLR